MIIGKYKYHVANMIKSTHHQNDYNFIYVIIKEVEFQVATYSMVYLHTVHAL